MAPRTFGSVDPAARKEAIQFTLQGLTFPDGLPWEETFSCLPSAPAGVLDDFVQAAGAFDGSNIWTAPSLTGFLRSVMLDADVERFDGLLHDKSRIVELQDLGELVMWLSSELMGRPTPPLSS